MCILPKANQLYISSIWSSYNFIYPSPDCNVLSLMPKPHSEPELGLGTRLLGFKQAVVLFLIPVSCLVQYFVCLFLYQNFDVIFKIYFKSIKHLA